MELPKDDKEQETTVTIEAGMHNLTIGTTAEFDTEYEVQTLEASNKQLKSLIQNWVPNFLSVSPTIEPTLDDTFDRGEILNKYFKSLHESYMESPTQQAKELSFTERHKKYLFDNSKRSLTLSSASESSDDESPQFIHNPYFDNALTLTNINKVYNGTRIPNRDAPKVGEICMISFMRNAAEMHIRVKETIIYFERLSAQLYDVFLTLPHFHKSKDIGRKEYVNFWIVEYNNDMYRVEVINWLLHERSDNVLVRFIDSGEMAVIKFSWMKPLPLKYMDIPRMAQSCHLRHISNYMVTKAANLTFKQILGNLKDAYFEITHVKYCIIRKSYEIDFKKIDKKLLYYHYFWN